MKLKVNEYCELINQVAQYLMAVRAYEAEAIRLRRAVERLETAECRGASAGLQARVSSVLAAARQQLAALHPLAQPDEAHDVPTIEF